MTVRLGIFATHPIQYQVPIWRALARVEGLESEVFYFSDKSIRGGVDAGFGVPVAWDVPLLEGYKSEFISRDGLPENAGGMPIPDPDKLFSAGKFDWVLIPGYTHVFERQIIGARNRYKYKIILRGELADDYRPGRKNLLKGFARYLYLSWFYRSVDVFCYPGRAGLMHLNRLGVPEKKFFHSPYCVDTDMLEKQYAAVDRATCRGELSIPDDRFVLLYCGKLIECKNLPVLIDAIKMAENKAKLVLVVVGDGPLKSQIIEAGEKVLGSRFMFQGFVNQSRLGHYYRLADALVLPSLHETWGLVVNEAMQFGLPAIVSDRAGCCRDMVVEGQTGYSFAADSAGQLAAAIDKLSADLVQAAKMGQQARRHILDGFTVRHSVNGILRATGLPISGDEPARRENAE